MADGALEEAFEVGRRYEAGLDDAARTRGAHFTPAAVATELTVRTLARWQGTGVPVMCDPCCGGGAFLVAAAEALWHRGADPRAVVEHHLAGGDTDVAAVAAADAALRVWAAGRGAAGAVPRRLTVGDALAADAPDRLGPVDVVVGNPPFRGQLGGATARNAEGRAAARTRFGAAAAGYVDDAVLFVLAALDLVGSGGVVTQILPRPVLVARDAAAARRRLLGDAVLTDAWLPGAPVFAAAVDVCALTFVLGAGTRSAAASIAPPVAVTSGARFEHTHPPVPAAALEGPTWSPLWASAHGVPAAPVPPADATRVGDRAIATAGFRDQFYGLAARVSDDEPARGARLVTTAHVDPGVANWGRRTVTVARRRWAHPWVDLDAVAEDPALAAWVARLLVPKVLVATQTRVIEAVADPAGAWVPLTPLIAVVPHDPADAPALAAALLAPPATAWALQRYGGGAMSATALKLSAAQVAEVPLPIDAGAWADATAMLADPGDGGPDWPAFGRVMCRSWGVAADDLVAWWWQRHPAAKVRTAGAASLH